MNGCSTIPSTLRKTAAKLFSASEEQYQFIESIMTGGGGRRALLWRRTARSGELLVKTEPFFRKFPELSHYLPDVSLVVEEGSPGNEHLHQAGAFYVLDTSSILAATVLTAVFPQPNQVLDLCAAPGGKSIFANTLFPEADLVANEVIGKRLAPLIANLKRCQVKSVRVTCLDPMRLVQQVPGNFDLCIVDAPCSGQSLPAEDKKWSGAFHESTVNMNANRQRRILACAADLVRPGGYIAYTTCTFSLKENESNSEWFLKKFSSFKPCAVPALEKWLSPYSDIPSYRFWPHRGEGRGGFAALFKHQGDRLNQEFLPREGYLPVAWQQFNDK